MASSPGGGIKLWEAMGAVGAAAQALVGMVAWMDSRNNGSAAKFLIERGAAAMFIILILVIVLLTAMRALRRMPIFTGVQQWLSIWALLAGVTWVLVSTGWFDFGGQSAQQVVNAPTAPAPKVEPAPVAPAVAEAAPEPVYVPPPAIPSAGRVETADSQEAFALAGGGAAGDGGLLANPSFDCTAATATAELAICGDDRLAALDRRLAEAYARRVARDRGIRDGQDAWIGARNAACGANATCIERMTMERIRRLQSATAQELGAPPPPPPAPAATGAPAAPAQPPAQAPRAPPTR